MEHDFKDRHWLDDHQADVHKLKNKNNFAGIAYQFLRLQEQMLQDFERFKAISHSGDKGGARENSLRNFLSSSKYLPQRFGVADGSSKVISTTGHSSDQMDILIYDSLNAPRLLSIDDLQYFPVETVYGVLEVKSDLSSKAVVFDALDKIKSYKNLKQTGPSQKRIGPLTYTKEGDLGFGIVFAYDASLKWSTLIEYIEEYQKENPASVWPNLIVVLNQGTIGQLKIIDSPNTHAVSLYQSREIEKLPKPYLYGNPSSNSGLLDFYLILMDLLTNIELQPVSIRKYVNLGVAAGKHTYTFGMGQGILEKGDCEKHGMYLRTVTEENLEKIINACQTTEQVSMSYIFSTVLKKDLHLNDKKEIKIYNPDNIPVDELLTLNKSSSGLYVDELIIDGQKYWIPHYYSHLHKLISECPKCSEDARQS